MGLLADPPVAPHVDRQHYPDGPLTTAERKQYAIDYRWFARKVTRRAFRGSRRGQAVLRQDPAALDSAADLALWRAVRRYDPTRGVRFATYLVRCCQSEVLQYTRLRQTPNVLGRHRTRPLPPDLLLPELTAPDLSPDAVDAAELLEWLLRSLPPRTRTVLRLLVDGHSEADVARALGVTRSRVSKILARTRPILAARLATPEAA